jgi:hypothetical protein
MLLFNIDIDYLLNAPSKAEMAGLALGTDKSAQQQMDATNKGKMAKGNKKKADEEKGNKARQKDAKESAYHRQQIANRNGPARLISFLQQQRKFVYVKKCG